MAATVPDAAVPDATTTTALSIIVATPLAPADHPTAFPATQR